MTWKKGRGKLGPFSNLLGSWICNKGSKDRTKPECTRVFEKHLDGKYIKLTVSWNLGDKSYDELCMIGVTRDKEVNFWSFTSDGKNARGWMADVTDVHPEAIGFEADMPPGRARQAYYPHEDGGFVWVVESQTKKGWNRFVEQHFTANG